MKYTLAFTALLTTALAQSSCAAPPAPSSSATPTPSGPSYFGVMSARSASPIHLLQLTARGGKFYLGGPGPSSYCPVEQVGDACPPGNSTVLAGGDKTLALGVVVPGGQQVYVAPDGSLSYTVAHSAYIPTGSIIDQFSVEAPADGQAFGYLHFETGFVACPAGEGQGYKVFGQVQGGTYGPECLGFSALTVATDEPGAWQY
ncbi:Nn.00g111510.m01.CDS01 [Neocucurbitaria sp. VM-36]